MRRHGKKRSGKSGLPPGTLVHIGEKSDEEVNVTVMDYDEGSFLEKTLGSIDECLFFKNKPTVTWINMDGIHQVELIRKFGDCYGFHPLVLEDILNTDQRPKLEDYGEYLYIVLKMLHHEKNSAIVPEQISLIVGKNFVFSFQEGVKGDVFDPIRERIRTGKGRIRNMGADYLAYSLIDAIVDNYFVVLEDMGERIEELEEEVATNPAPPTLSGIHKLTRDMKFLTVIGTIFMPLTFIVGVYGMNFQFMPELGWRWGYFSVILIMTGIAGGMVVYFKRRKWF